MGNSNTKLEEDKGHIVFNEDSSCKMAFVYFSGTDKIPSEECDLSHLTKESLEKAFEAVKPEHQDTGRVVVLSSAYGGMAHQNFLNLMKESMKS